MSCQGLKEHYKNILPVTKVASSPVQSLRDYHICVLSDP